LQYSQHLRRQGIDAALEAKLARANAYLDAHKLSVLRHGFRPKSACKTDVRATWARAQKREGGNG